MTSVIPQDTAQTNDPLAAFNFSYDPAISSMVKKELIDTLSRGRKPLRKIIEAQLKGRDIVQEYQATLAPLGLRHDNLADTMAAFWVVMWVIIHDANMPPPEWVEAVRRQVLLRLKGNAAARDPAKRQMMGEGMIYEAHLALQTWEQAKLEGSDFQLRQMAKSGRQNMISKGIDLGNMHITDKGFQSS